MTRGKPSKVAKRSFITSTTVKKEIYYRRLYRESPLKLLNIMLDSMDYLKELSLLTFSITVAKKEKEIINGETYFRLIGENGFQPLITKYELKTAVILQDLLLYLMEDALAARVRMGFVDLYKAYSDFETAYKTYPILVSIANKLNYIPLKQLQEKTKHKIPDNLLKYFIANVGDSEANNIPLTDEIYNYKYCLEDDAKIWVQKFKFDSTKNNHSYEEAKKNSSWNVGGPPIYESSN